MYVHQGQHIGGWGEGQKKTRGNEALCSARSAVEFIFEKGCYGCSVTRSGDLSDFGQLLNAFGNT